MANTTLSPLHRADGSATYSINGYKVIAAVNGPIEVQRRDELPEEAAIDVTVRPASGLGGVRERHLESIIQNTLRHVILVSAHPRTLIQITLQIVADRGHEFTSGNVLQADSSLPVLPALLQASILALLSTSIPLSMTLTATMLAVEPKGTITTDPSPQELRSASSIHVLAFSSLGDLLLVESEGDFSMETWDEVDGRAFMVCHGKDRDDSDHENVNMDSEDEVKLERMLRDAVQGKVLKEREWKQRLS